MLKLSVWESGFWTSERRQDSLHISVCKRRCLQLSRHSSLQMIATDRQRQENREALTAIRKDVGDKVWLQRSSNNLWKLPKDRAIAILEQGGVHRAGAWRAASCACCHDMRAKHADPAKALIHMTRYSPTGSHGLPTPLCVAIVRFVCICRAEAAGDPARHTDS